MELRQLEAFVEAAQRGSISGAAKSLFVTQPSLTQRLRALETEMGQQLLVRSRQGVRLTPAGKLFLPRAEAALAALRRGADEVKELREVAGGRLGIAATPDVATFILPAVLGRFRREHPAVELSLRTGASMQMASLLTSDQAEVALVNHSVNLPDVHELCLYEEPLLPVAAPDHPLSLQERVTLDAFAVAGLLIQEAPGSLRDLTMSIFAASRRSPKVVLHAPDTDTVRRMAIAGVGVAVLPELSVREDVAANRLAVLALDKVRLPTRGLWVLRPEAAQQGAATHAFLELLVSEGLPRGARLRRPPRSRPKKRRPPNPQEEREGP